MQTKELIQRVQDKALAYNVMREIGASEVELDYYDYDDRCFIQEETSNNKEYIQLNTYYDQLIAKEPIYFARVSENGI